MKNLGRSNSEFPFFFMWQRKVPFTVLLMLHLEKNKKIKKGIRTINKWKSRSLKRKEKVKNKNICPNVIKVITSVTLLQYGGSVQHCVCVKWDDIFLATWSHLCTENFSVAKTSEKYDPPTSDCVPISPFCPLFAPTPHFLVHSVSHTAFFSLKHLSWYFTCAYLPFSHSIFVICVRLHWLPNDNTSLNALIHFTHRTHPSQLSTPTDNISFIPLTICLKLLIAVRCYNDCCCLNTFFFRFNLLRSRRLSCFLIFLMSSFLLFHQQTSDSFSSSTSFSSRHSCLCCSLFSINAITTVAIIISSANTIQSPSFFFI